MHSTSAGAATQMPPRFVADAMVGRLARRLRAFGFDVTYDPFVEDAALVAQARGLGAILLTRDTGLRQVAGVRVILIESDHVEEQVRQVVWEAPLDLEAARPLTRCTVCNGALLPASRAEVADQVPPYIYLTQEQYARCQECGRVYWAGTHVPRLLEQLRRLERQAEACPTRPGAKTGAGGPACEEAA